jgi:transposase InsO family protein
MPAIVDAVTSKRAKGARWGRKKKKKKKTTTTPPPPPPKKKQKTALEEVLTQAYYDPKSFAAYSGVKNLRDYLLAKDPPIEVSEVKIREWLLSQPTYTTMKGARKRFKSPKTLTSGPSYQFQADLVDMRAYVDRNAGHQHILTVIDVFSKRAYCEPLKVKSGPAVTEAMRRVFLASVPRPPEKLHTDEGREFMNPQMRALLEEYRVEFFVTTSKHKAAVVER